MAADPVPIVFDEALRADLRRRLAATRWSDAVAPGWGQGMDARFLRALVETWGTRYDFGEAQDRLNRTPQHGVEIDGFRIAYHAVRGAGPAPKPLLLMNGWPSSFVEYRRLAPMLADPAAFGGSPADAFDVVMPTLPGFGWSDRPSGCRPAWAEDLFQRLMTEHLGHRRYVASGTDIGAGIATRLALRYPGSVAGIHIASVVDPVLAPRSRPPDPEERAYLARAARWEAEEGGYEHEQYTKPQTLAFALADSPAGLASWIVEKFHSWSDHGPDLLATFPADMLLDNLMVYWATNTIGSSMRTYWQDRHGRTPFVPGDRVTVPTAVCMWPHDLLVAPRAWAERFYRVRRYTLQARGGHFPAWEAPAAYAEDLRAFARTLDV